MQALAGHVPTYRAALLSQSNPSLTSKRVQGMFYRTARMLEAGIKPVFVFDGKPPEIKRAQLDQRLER